MVDHENLFKSIIVYIHCLKISSVPSLNQLHIYLNYFESLRPIFFIWHIFIILLFYETVSF